MKRIINFLFSIVAFSSFASVAQPDKSFPKTISKTFYYKNSEEFKDMNEATVKSKIKKDFIKLSPHDIEKMKKDGKNLSKEFRIYLNNDQHAKLVSEQNDNNFQKLVTAAFQKKTNALNSQQTKDNLFALSISGLGLLFGFVNTDIAFYSESKKMNEIYLGLGLVFISASTTGLYYYYTRTDPAIDYQKKQISKMQNTWNDQFKVEDPITDATV